MALSNCKDCGRLFNKINRDICPACIQEEDRKFFVIRNYLKEHRNAHIHEVNEATGVEVKLIIKFIREGRLSTGDNPNIHFPCEACGTAITEGRFCRPCKDKLQKGFDQTRTELQSGAAGNQTFVDYHHKPTRR